MWMFLLFGMEASDTRDAATKRAVNIGFMKFIGWIVLGFAILGLVATIIEKAHARTTQRTYQESMGRNVGRSITDTRGNTTFYDSMGRQTGRSTTSNGTTTVYDQMGRQRD